MTGLKPGSAGYRRLARSIDEFDHLVELKGLTPATVIIHGTAYKVTKPGGSQFFFDTVGSKDKTLKLYEGYVHVPLNDVGKEVVVGDIIAWLDARA